MKFCNLVKICLLYYFEGLKTGGNSIKNENFFDTLKIQPQMSIDEIQQRAKEKRVNLRYYDDECVGLIDIKSYENL